MSSGAVLLAAEAQMPRKPTTVDASAQPLSRKLRKALPVEASESSAKSVEASKCALRCDPYQVEMHRRCPHWLSCHDLRCSKAQDIVQPRSLYSQPLVYLFVCLAQA